MKTVATINFPRSIKNEMGNWVKNCHKVTADLAGSLPNGISLIAVWGKLSLGGLANDRTPISARMGIKFMEPMVFQRLMWSKIMLDIHGLVGIIKATISEERDCVSLLVKRFL